MPDEFLNALAHADQILSLQENLDAKEMPPEWMWPLAWEMERHMDRVVSDRKAKYGIEDDEDPDYEDTGRWEQNELAEAWK